jgi:hypothetical protein
MVRTQLCRTRFFAREDVGVSQQNRPLPILGQDQWAAVQNVCEFSRASFDATFHVQGGSSEAACSGTAWRSDGSKSSPTDGQRAAAEIVREEELRCWHVFRSWLEGYAGDTCAFQKEVLRRCRRLHLRKWRKIWSAS